ncbi:hypothetical protein V1478_015242 [Vespula squamosa]|uniref:Uncharacterized protein n=1 Tax=Vespula squamosa TaxID=30214 RepID=A0ABD2A4J2_VESSQ
MAARKCYVTEMHSVCRNNLEKLEVIEIRESMVLEKFDFIPPAFEKTLETVRIIFMRISAVSRKPTGKNDLPPYPEDKRPTRISSFSRERPYEVFRKIQENLLSSSRWSQSVSEND